MPGLLPCVGLGQQVLEEIEVNALVGKRRRPRGRHGICPEAFAEFRQRVDAEAPPGQAIEKSLATLGGSVGLVLAHAKQNHLVVLDRIRVGQMVYADVGKSASQCARAVSEGLLRYDKDKDAAGDKPPVAVLEKHLLQAFVVRGACLEVVGRIEVEQGHLLDLAGDLDGIAMDGGDPGRGTCLGAVWTAPRK